MKRVKLFLCVFTLISLILYIRPQGQFDIKSRGQREKIAVIVAVRNRPTEEFIFRLYMNYFLSRNNPNADFHFVFVEQVDENKFNKGRLLNVAYLLLSSEDFDCFCFHDVDTLPPNDNVPYRCPRGKRPYHLTPAAIHPHVHYKLSLAGNFFLTKTQIEKVNGFATEFWGWGRLDDNLVKRFMAKKLWPPEKPKDLRAKFIHLDLEQSPRTFWPSTVPENFTHMVSLLIEDIGQYGLNTTKYTILSDEKITEKVRRVKVSLLCDVTLTPWCKS